jgi:hypothetical protein
VGRLILGLVFVALGLCGSIAMFWPAFHAPPAVERWLLRMAITRPLMAI